MIRRILVGCTFAALIVACSPAMAGWGSHGSSGGSSGGSWGSSGGSSGGSWGSSGGSSGGSWGSSGGSSGGSWGRHSRGGLFARKHARRHYRSHYSSGGSWGSSGGSSGGKYYYSSGGSWGSSGGSSGGSSIGGSYYEYYTPTETAPMPATPADAEGGSEVPVPPVDPSTSINSGSATLTVSLPEAARVFVNGRETNSTGAERTYVSRGLQPGFDYTYEVRAQYERDGQKLEETKVVSLRAGRRETLTFEFAGEQTAQQATDTTLTLKVPANAKVFLAGTETRAMGEVRSYRTQRLSDGEAWNDYVVRVTLEQEGRTLSQERTITLVGGLDREMTFEFAQDRVASVR